MMKGASTASKQGKVKNSLHDKTFTPRGAAAATMQILDIEKTDHCLDPARGGGAFYDQFACDEDHKHYCEIDEGIDFLTWTPPEGVKMDWIITNPRFGGSAVRWDMGGGVGVSLVGHIWF